MHKLINNMIINKWSYYDHILNDHILINVIYTWNKLYYDKVYLLNYYFKFEHVHHLLDKAKNDLIHCGCIFNKTV
jgi:hypothetical protein